MALFMTDGKPVDITLTLTGKGFESRSPGNLISVITGQSLDWGRQEQ
jgi:hypothetical protein